MIVAKLRCAIDVLKNRMPGALAMTRAESISISTHARHLSNGAAQHSCTITFHFGSDSTSKSKAYRAIERIYEMDRVQEGRFT